MSQITSAILRRPYPNGDHVKKSCSILLSVIACLGVLATPAAATIDPASFTGVGDDVVRVRLTEHGVIKARYRGDSNFAIWTLNRRGAKKELLVNTIGTYRGVVEFEAGPRSKKISAIQVEADGPWSMRLKRLVGARNWRKASTSGLGDNVLQVFRRRLTLTAAYAGENNFAVWALDAEGHKLDLLVNTIGDYRGTTVMPAGTRYVSITAGSGDRWTVVKR